MLPLRSEITKKILCYFFLNPHESLYVNELARTLNLDKRNLVKKIRELEAGGILLHQTRGNLKLYSINRKFPLYDEYRGIILATIGFEEQLRTALKKVAGVKEAYIYGSYAGNTMDVHSDIDVIAVGNFNMLSLQKQVNAVQKEAGREINVVNMDETEFKKRIKNRDPFISGVLHRKHIRLI